MSKHTKILLTFCSIFLVLVVHSEVGAPSQSSSSTYMEMMWRSHSLPSIEITLAERRRIAYDLPAVSGSGESIGVPNDSHSDPTDDLLFKWLSPDNADYGLAVSGLTLTSQVPNGPLGFPLNFYWSVVTFDCYDPGLASYDQVPDWGSVWWDGTPVYYDDSLNAFVPSFADLRRVSLTRTGDETRWQLTSEGALPGLPDAYQLGYNIFMDADHLLVQFIGATAFTSSGWWWAIQDRGDLFPWWGDDLDITNVVVDQPSDTQVTFEAEIAGALHPSYGESDAFPHFYWYIDSDDNKETGDSFTFGYQEGNYVFEYELEGIEAVVQAFYDETTDRWLGILRKMIGPNQWETVATATPYLTSNRVVVTFDRSDTGVYSTFRWGLLSCFQVTRGGLLYSGNVDVAPNSGMQTQTLAAHPDQALAEQYAPVLYRAGSEVYYPVSIDYTLRTSDLKHGTGQIHSPTVDDLVGHATDGSRLDLDGTKPSESQRSWANGSGRDPVVYARVVRDGNVTVIQYWLHYYYSSWGYTKGCDWPGVICVPWGGNNHEGDWEMIQVVLQNDAPTHAVYAQHFGGSKRSWEYVEKQGDHPVVYVGWGSHASFFKDAYYYQHGFWPETTGRTGTPTLDVRLLPSDSDPRWLEFRGEWGVDFGSPTGPRWENATEECGKWDNPINWWQEETHWDEEENYGGCEIGLVGPERRRNWRVCTSGPFSRWLKPVLRDLYGNVLIDPDTNTIDPTGRGAEYLLNCENGGKQSIILYKTDYLWAVGEVVLDLSGDRCSTSMAQSSVAANSSISITLTLPDLADEEILLIDFIDVVFTDTTVGRIRLDGDSPQLELDHDNDGTFDDTVEPDGLLRQPADFSPPATIGNLSIVEDGLSIELQWTAPGNDGTEGTATYYDVRYAEFPVTEETWDYATPIPHSLAPSAAGTVERLPVEAVSPGNHFFAVRTFDQDYNVSNVSNTVEGTVQFGVFLPLILR